MNPELTPQTTSLIAIRVALAALALSLLGGWLVISRPAPLQPAAATQPDAATPQAAATQPAAATPQALEQNLALVVRRIGAAPIEPAQPPNVPNVGVE